MNIVFKYRRLKLLGFEKKNCRNFRPPPIMTKIWQNVPLNISNNFLEEVEAQF